jgi:threonine dehydratase
VKSEKISLVTIEAIREAAARIAGVAVKTPLVRAPFPGLAGYGFQKEIRLKAESLQPIGAFKMRGAANKILQLTPDEIARGVITYSSGNHAQAVRGGREGGDRDAVKCAGHQARGDPGAGS